MDTTKGTGSSQVHCRHMRQGPKSWFSHGTHVTKASSVRQAVGSCMGIASVAYRMRARLHYISFLLYCSVCLESQTSPQPTACCPGWCVYIYTGPQSRLPQSYQAGPLPWCPPSACPRFTYPSQYR